MCATPGFSKMFSLLQRRRNANSTPRPPGAARCNGDTKAGYFGVLPLELTQLIATFLPPSSAASLALTSHTLLHILGTQHFPYLDPYIVRFEARDSETLEDHAVFLKGLVRDLPAGSSFYCYHCHKVHLLPLRERRTICMETRCVQELWTPTHERIFNRLEESLCQRGKSSYNEDPDSNANTRTVYHHRFCFEHVQMAMQLHQRGSTHLVKGYLAHLSLTRKIVIEMSLFGGYKGFHFFEPRIVDDQMIVRAQSWIVIPSNDSLNYHKQFRLPRYLYNTTACAHLDLRHGEDNPLTWLLRCRLAHVRYPVSSPCISCGRNLRCPMCPTEVQVDIKTFHDGKSKTTKTIMLVITRWQLVGGGTSPYEGHWAHRLSNQSNPWHWPNGDSVPNFKNTYENQPGPKFDAILDAGEAWKLVRKCLKDYERWRTV